MTISRKSPGVKVKRQSVSPFIGRIIGKIDIIRKISHPFTWRCVVNGQVEKVGNRPPGGEETADSRLQTAGRNIIIRKC